MLYVFDPLSRPERYGRHQCSFFNQYCWRLFSCLCRYCYQQRRPRNWSCSSRDGCVWCQKWHAEIGPGYPNTQEARRAPLRLVDINKPIPDDLEISGWNDLHRHSCSLKRERKLDVSGDIRAMSFSGFFWKKYSTRRALLRIRVTIGFSSTFDLQCGTRFLSGKFKINRAGQDGISENSRRNGL